MANAATNSVDKVKRITSQQIGAIRELKGEIDRLRNEISSLKAEREEVERSLLILPEAMQNVDSYIAERAQQYLENVAVGGFLHPGGVDDQFSIFPYLYSKTVEQSRGFVSLPVHDIEGALCAFQPEAIRERFRQLLEARLKGQKCLSTEERERRLAELDRQRLDLERTEERIIVAAEEAGLSIARRADADPRAVLEIDD